uniref:Piwi domain-containing protein n=1 Tax=Caenorhabditis tropicalis TaxID=1561998 RepID=A0A1I7U447_9PELO
MMALVAERRRRRHNFPEPRNGAHHYMRALRGEHTNTLFIAYTVHHGTVDPSTPGVFNNPSTAVVILDP